VGRIHTYLRQYDEAHEHLRTAVAMLLDNGTDPEAAASALLNLATLLFDLKEVDEATRAYEKVLDLTESDLLRAKALNGLARGYTAAGDRQRGLQTSFSAIQLSSAIGDSYSEASAVDTMAHIHHELGHHHRAVRAYHRAVALFDRLGDDLNLAYTQWSMGDCLAEIRDRDGARVAWQSAFGILSRVDPRAAEEVRARIGSLEAA
jgi:tetratricopeptide (TPR) repeat protein